jgi:hypothetical protein
MLLDSPVMFSGWLPLGTVARERECIVTLATWVPISVVSPYFHCRAINVVAALCFVDALPEHAIPQGSQYIINGFHG